MTEKINCYFNDGMNEKDEIEDLIKYQGIGHGRINDLPLVGSSGGRGRIKLLINETKRKKTIDEKLKPIDVDANNDILLDQNILGTSDHVINELSTGLVEEKKRKSMSDSPGSFFAERRMDKKTSGFKTAHGECKISRSEKGGREKFKKRSVNKSNSDFGSKKNGEHSIENEHQEIFKSIKLPQESNVKSDVNDTLPNNSSLCVDYISSEEGCSNLKKKKDYNLPAYNLNGLQYRSNEAEKPKENFKIVEDISDKQNTEIESESKTINTSDHSRMFFTKDFPMHQDSNDHINIKTTKSLGRGLLFSPYIDSTHINKVADKLTNEVPEKPNTPEKSLVASSFNVEENKDIVEVCIPEVENDHEDRYFDIEEPTYLDCYTKEFFSQSKSEEVLKPGTEVNNEDYEKLVGFIKNNEHEPIDSKALIKAEAEILEQQILRDYSVGQLTEKMKMACGLIHGNVVAHPVFKLSELKLQPQILSNLNAKNMRELSRSQMFAVPVLLQRKNLVLIGPPNSGKTLAYVMAVLSLLQEDEYYSSLKPGNGPRCVFISSCAQNVNYISQFCSAICGAKLTIITTHGGGLELERKEDLTNGCEILVTTPRCWLRLLKHTSVTNLTRLCHLIFDDTDTLLSKFLPEVQEISNNINKMLHIRKRYCKVGIQAAFVGEKWSPILEEITFKALDSPVLCITAHLEAALYSRIKPKTYILSPDSKLKKLKELLNLTSQKIRTVVVCKCANEVKLLRPLIQPILSDVLVAHEEMNLSRVIEVSDQWIRCISPPILLCSDMILNELAVTNAQWLIHFSMPDNKTSFSERFSTIKEHLYDRLKYPKTAPPECQVHILVDDTNELQFPEIINFMERLNTPIPELFLQAVKKISVLKEEMKNDALFCENLLMFGNCWKQDKCKRQHIFNKSRDNAKNLPVNGTMKVKLLYAHNPSHYSIRILATKNSCQEWIEFPSNYACIGFKMSNYYSSRENRFAHGRVKVGDMVAIEVEPDLLFKRAKVIDVATRDKKCNPEQVIVHFIDEGSIDKYSTSQILHLPPDLQVYPQEAYDMYLTGLQPVDCDNAWSFASTMKIQKSISDLNFSDGDNKFFIANIILAAGTKLLATSFLCYEWLDLNKCHVVLFSPRKFILDTGLAESNSSHVTSIMQLALEAGLITEIPEDLKIEEPDIEKEEIQWAHLEKNISNVVHVISSESPSFFYLKIYKFGDRLDDLEKELADILNSKTKKIEVIHRDLVCAARNPAIGRWNRVIVNEVINSGEVEVFFVDYGDYMVLPISELSHLPSGFVKRLPFQAIECSLIGIKPLDDSWLPESFEVFDKMCFNDENKLISMFAKVCEFTKADLTSGLHFKVVLAFSKEKKSININKELVYQGFANWDQETKHYLVEDICFPDSEYFDDSDENDYIMTKKNDYVMEEDGQCEKKSLKGCEFTSSVSEGTSQNNDVMKLLAKDDFELENFDHLINFLPDELQHQLKQRNISTAMNELSEMKSLEYKKELNEEIQVTEVGKVPNPEKEEIIEQGPRLDNCGVFHPTVYWSQGDIYVRLKVNLPGIETFQIDHSDQSLIFRTLLNDKYYWFHILLFGKICKEKVNYSPKGLYFEIKMEKFIKGELWPRLIYDDFKFPWIKIDPESLEQDDLTLIESMFNKGSKRDMLDFYTHKRSYFHSYGRPEADSDLESDNSSLGSEHFHDMMHDGLDSD